MFTLKQKLPKVDKWHELTQFKIFLESHLEWLKENHTYETKVLEGSFASLYTGDLYGLLSVMSVPIEYHYITCRINDYASPLDFDGKRLVLKLINPDEIEILKNVFKTNQDIKI